MNTHSKKCSVEGCEKPFRCKGLCQSHYQRLYHGRPLEGPIGISSYEGTKCALEDCDRSAKGGAKGYCSMHYMRLWKHGDPEVVLSSSPGKGAECVHFKGDDITYSAIHMRVRVERECPGYCEWCGSKHNLQWALDHANAEGTIRFGDNGGYECAYSTDINDYIRLCAKCHHAYDRQARELGTKVGL